MSDGAPGSNGWERIEELFDRAIELDPAHRPDFLSQATDDDSVRRAVEEMLRAAEAPGPLDHPVGELAQTLTREAAARAGGSTLETRRTVGAWRILESLGGGGMGRVFLAERHQGSFEQVAALKLLRWELASAALVERFENEQRILARLEHPGIARLIDGGVSDEGLPYLVMEYVDGQPIDRYCDLQDLSVEPRLELFLQVCDAVQAAHRHLIVHRDLKPSNILVTADGRARLLDFGVGKFLEATAESDLTGTHLAPATPGYAAPEQLTGDQVTTATDVYALGALLYQLLAGSMPFELEGCNPSQFARTILETDPAPPSARLEGKRGAALRGDLDNITLTALRKEPERRYPSVDRLAADVRRYLTGRPVDATPETWTYRAGKLVRRNRLVVAAAGLAAAAIVSGLVATTWQAEKVKQEAAKAARVADFLSSLLSSANPYDRNVRAHSLEDVLREAAERLETELIDQPDVRATLLTRIGTGYYRLLRRDSEAWDLLSEAERELEARGDSTELAELWLEKAMLASERGEFETQRRLADRAKTFFAGTQGPRSEGVARALLVEALALQYEGDPKEADRVGREALGLVEALPDPPALLVAECLRTLGTIAEILRNHEQSIDLNRRALAIFQRAGGRHDPDVIAIHDELGISYHSQGRYQEAERSYKRAIELHETRFGPNHPNAIDQLTDLARLLLDQGRFSEALEQGRRAVEASSGLPSTDFERVATEINLATAELETGAVASAEARYRSSLDRFLEALGEDHPAVARARSLLADALRLRGDLEQAEILYRLALHPENRRREEAWLGLARVLVDTGRSGEAVGLFERALAKRLETLPEGHWRVFEVEAELARLSVREGRSEEATTDLGRVTEALAATVGAENWRVTRLRS